jgi:hypothetical protein
VCASVLLPGLKFTIQDEWQDGRGREVIRSPPPEYLPHPLLLQCRIFHSYGLYN